MPDRIILNTADVPGLNRCISEISYMQICGTDPDVRISEESDGLYKISFSAFISEDTAQNDWNVKIIPDFIPSHSWTTHLTPGGENVIDMHVFRSPLAVMNDGGRMIRVFPDLSMDFLSVPRVYMDMDAPNRTVTLGMAETEVSAHVLYRRRDGAVYKKGKIEFSLYIDVCGGESEIANPYRKILKYYWENYGREQSLRLLPESGSLIRYVNHTYNWVFCGWKGRVWQEFDIGGKRVGAPAFIVNTTQSPNYKAPFREREMLSVWNQAWFSSLRSASGLYRYGKFTGNDELVDKALMTKELALAAPMKNGFFPTVISTEMEDIEIDGKKYSRSRGWDTKFWGNSNRNPFTWSVKDSPLSILDMSWTCLLMLRWHKDIESDIRLVRYAEKYAEALLKIQTDEGFFPSWLDENLKPYDILTVSPQTSMSVTFLMELFKISGDEKYRASALKAMSAVIDNIVYEHRWEDFETYWSCCRYGSDSLVGKKVERNDMYKQCNFSVFWTAEALLECYLSTGNEKFSSCGRRCLDELLMYQNSWQPPYFKLPVVGGFGVMNCDGELNDSRQSLFAGLILKYGKIFGETEYIERGLAALKVSFVLMYCPENPHVKSMWESTWDFFGEEDFGFMMENYGHGGAAGYDSLDIGEFTIYDWGNGAASEAYMRISAEFPEYLGV